MAGIRNALAQAITTLALRGFCGLLPHRTFAMTIPAIQARLAVPAPVAPDSQRQGYGPVFEVAARAALHLLLQCGITAFLREC